MTDAAHSFEPHRASLMRLAYGMLGSKAEAEDVVQDAYLRWQGQDSAQIDNARAWLMRVTGRLALDQLRSARLKRTDYVGPWLPEPLALSLGDSPPPEQAMLDDETLSYALMVAMEKLAPEERAAFVLHDAFDYGYDTLAGLLDKSEAACRQLVSRARKHLKGDRDRFQVDGAAHQKFLLAFQQAAVTGDVSALEKLMLEDAVLLTDGGGQVIAALNPIYGANKVARFFVGIGSKTPAGMVHKPVWFNGGPGILSLADGAPYMLTALWLRDGAIAGIYTLRNPDKLRQITSTLAE